MESYKDWIKAEWKKVEDFYKSITPKHELVTKVENATHIQAHYLMMILSVLLVFVVYIITRRIFANVVVIIPTFFFCVKDLHEGKNEKKWMYYWMLFSLLAVYSNILSHIYYFGVIKVGICYYFAFFDKECYLEKGVNYLYEGICTALEKLKTTCNVKVE